MAEERSGGAGRSGALDEGVSLTLRRGFLLTVIVEGVARNWNSISALGFSPSLLFSSLDKKWAGEEGRNCSSD